MGTDEKEMNMKNKTLPRLHCPMLESAIQKVEEMLACCVCLMVEMVMAVAILLPESSIWPHMALAYSQPHVQPKERAGKNRLSFHRTEEAFSSTTQSVGLLPLQGEMDTNMAKPWAMPWAESCNWAFSPPIPCPLNRMLVASKNASNKLNALFVIAMSLSDTQNKQLLPAFVRSIVRQSQQWPASQWGGPVSMR